MASDTEPHDPRHPVLILSPLHHLHESPLSEKFRFLKPWEASPLSPEQFIAEKSDSIRALLCTFLPPVPVDARVIASLPRLECVVTPSTGVNHIDLDECRRRGIAVGNIGTAFSDDTAEYAVGLLIDVLRRISAADRYVRGGLWRTYGECPRGSRLKGKRVGILGLGSIGLGIARRLEGFGCLISYHSRTEKPTVSYQFWPSAVELAAQNDVLIVSCSLTGETCHIVNRSVLEALGKHGILINIARGGLMEDRELVRCLMEGVIKGAGLDVYENEPNIPRELFQMDNVVLSPHVAAFTEESTIDVIRICVGNLEAFFAGKPLLFPVPL